MDKIRKLKLKKEVIANLNNVEMNQIRGGATGTLYDCFTAGMKQTFETCPGGGSGYGGGTGPGGVTYGTGTVTDKTTAACPTQKCSRECPPAATYNCGGGGAVTTPTRSVNDCAPPSVTCLPTDPYW